LYFWFKEELEKRKLWSVFAYLFWGVVSTIVNIVSFAIAYNNLGLSWPISNFISWVFAVAVAFITNKLWVFHSTTSGIIGLLWELSKFVFARVLSLGLDMLCMYIIIDLLNGNNLIAKFITQIIVVVVNYVFSKLLIFTSKA
jgi:putative flippase GtrA